MKHHKYVHQFHLLTMKLVATKSLIHDAVTVDITVLIMLVTVNHINRVSTKVTQQLVPMVMVISMMI